MPRRACKIDANHGEIVGLLRGLGAYVIDTAHVGSGFPDCIVGWRRRWIFCEIKDGDKPPSARKLTPHQIPLHAECERRGLPCVVIATPDQALALLGAREAA